MTPFGGQCRKVRMTQVLVFLHTTVPYQLAALQLMANAASNITERLHLPDRFQARSNDSRQIDLEIREAHR